MNALRSIVFFFLIVFVTLTARAQTPAQKISNLRYKVFANTADSIRLDSLSIIPNTILIPGVAADDYHLDFINSILYWKKKPIRDSIAISYRVFFYKLNAVTQRMRYDSIMNNMSLTPYEFNNELTDAEKGIFNFGNIKAEGSFGRQISFGNSQDAVLNSTLNLQLSGMLGDSIEIQAAITDNNIPIQPDGTTQQLNEFDQEIGRAHV